MDWGLSAVRMQMQYKEKQLSVRTLIESDIVKVAEAVNDPNGWSGQKWGIDNPDKIAQMLLRQLESYQRREVHPFVYFVNDEVAGISRFHSFFPLRRAFELGGTCVAPKWRRSFVNTGVKKLLLNHAFEQLKAVRVELRVDCANYRSQLNVLRLGANFEGKIRHWQIRPTGEVPDGLLYSITNNEWPVVKNRLSQLLDGVASRDISCNSKYLPLSIPTERLTLKTMGFNDANDLYTFTEKNRSILTESFPRSCEIKNAQDALARIAEEAHAVSNGSKIFYAVREKSTGEFIGRVQLNSIDWLKSSADIGFALDSEKQRNGFAFEMINQLTNLMFEKYNFKRITLHTLMHNERCIRLAKKLGFVQEGILKSSFVNGQGVLVDKILFAKVR